MSIKTEIFTAAIMDAIAPHVSGGQLRQVRSSVEEAVKLGLSGEVVEVEANAAHSTLGEKFQSIISAMLPPTAPRNQVLFGQALFLAGAHSVFQILAHAETKPKDECVKIWTDLQAEIKAAAPRKENLVETPPEKRLII